MSDMVDDFEDDDEDETPVPDPKLPKVLRQQNKKLAADLKEIQDKYADLEKKQRKADIAQALETHGAPGRLAKYFDGDDTSADGVKQWLVENGEDFGFVLDDGEVDEAVTSVNRVSAITNGARATNPGPTLDRLRDRSLSVQDLGLV